MTMLPIKKVDIINNALSRMTISGGITSPPKGREVQKLLARMENMALEFFSRNMDVGYNFEDDPDPNSDSNIDREFQNAFETNLAVRSLSDFGKTTDPALVQDLIRQASQSLSNMAARTAQVRPVQYPRRHPIGSGSTQRITNKWIRYFRPAPLPPISAETNDLIVDNVEDYTEHWDQYLRDTETIASFTIDSTDQLTIISSSNTDTDVSYRARPEEGADELEQVTIVITTSTGRVNTRVINFNITDLEC